MYERIDDTDTVSLRIRIRTVDSLVPLCRNIPIKYADNAQIVAYSIIRIENFSVEYLRARVSFTTINTNKESIRLDKFKYWDRTSCEAVRA